MKNSLLPAFLLLALIAAICAQAATPLYKGRPIVRVAYPSQHPNIGYAPSFGSVQFYGDGVHYIAVDNQYTNRGLYFSSGAAPATAAAPTLVLPDSFGALKTTDFNFRSHAADGLTVFAAETTDDKLAFLQIDAAGSLSVLFDASTATMPNSGGLAFSRLGEANAHSSKVAFIGIHNDEGGTPTFRGVYVLQDDTLVTIADSNTTLPGGVGSFDGSSSQVGFDGATVAFWGIHGSTQTNDQRQGIFASTIGGTLTAIAVDGDIIPGTETPIDSFLSPPHVVGTNVYFGAFDAAFNSYLLRSKDGVLETLIKPGDTIDGHAITQIAAAGFDVSGDTVYFNATKNARSVILSQTGDQAPVVAIDDTVMPGFHQFAVRDVEGDRIVFSDSTYVYATLDSPATPVLTRDLADQSGTYDPGSTVTLSVDALGQAPLAFEWRLNGIVIEEANGPTLEIADFQAADAGYYTLRATNANGTAVSASANLILNAPPSFPAPASSLTVEAGFPLNINLQIAGLTPMTYQWSKDGDPIESATNKNYYRAEATPADSGTYTQTAINDLGQATSAEVTVTVNPAPENPAWAGRQFDSQFAFPLTIGDLTLSAFATTAPYPGGFLGNAYDAATLYKSIVFVPSDGAPVNLVTVADLNQATGKTYANIYLGATDAAGNVILYANDATYSFYSVFVREADGTLTTIASSGDPVPGQPDKTFRAVYAIAIDGDQRLYGGTIDGTTSFVVKATPSGSTTVLDASTTLPDADFAVKSPIPSLFEQGSFYFIENSSDYQKSALFRYDASGEISLLLKTGDPLGADESLVTTFSTLQRFQNKLYLAESNAGIIEVGDRSATLALGPNSPVRGGGTMGSVYQFVATTETTAYLLQSYIPETGSQRQAIFAWDGTDLRLAFSPSHIDGRRIISARFWSLDPDGKLYAGVTFADNSIAVVANLGAEVEDPDPDPDPDRPPFSLPASIEYQILGKSLVRIFIPEGKTLQSSPNLIDPWTDIPGTTQIDISLTGEKIFFRLRDAD